MFRQSLYFKTITAISPCYCLGSRMICILATARQNHYHGHLKCSSVASRTAAAISPCGRLRTNIIRCRVFRQFLVSTLSKESIMRAFISSSLRKIDLLAYDLPWWQISVGLICVEIIGVLIGALLASVWQHI